MDQTGRHREVFLLPNLGQRCEVGPRGGLWMPRKQAFRPHPALCRMSQGLETTSEANKPMAPIGFTPMEPGFGNWSL